VAPLGNQQSTFDIQHSNITPMNHRTAFLILSLLLSVPVLHGQALTTGAEIYQQACATCHGDKLQGGQAQSLVDAIWQFGAKRSAQTRNIKYGIPDFAMPSFEGGLTDKQINLVLDYILDAEKKGGATKPPPPTELHTLDYKIKVEVVTDNLEIPWGITFPRKNLALVTERPGRVRRIVNGKLQAEPVKATPEVVHQGQGGLLDIAIDPDHSENKWVYLAYSHALKKKNDKDRPGAMTRIVRGRIKNNTWTDQEVVYEAPHELYLGTRHHYGSRIVFDSKGHLYFGIGDRGIQDQAQDLSRPNGKIHRINRDGSIPKDNPFLKTKNALPTIFTYGNRNPQGLAVHPFSGHVWESEHGPMGGDELNRLVAGSNYGWPIATYGRNYDGAIITDVRKKKGIAPPSLYWRPSIAPGGIEFVRGTKFPLWKNHLLVSALKYEEVRLLELRGPSVIHQEIILKNAGRVRDVGCAPDGAIYVVLNGPDSILRLTPGGEE